MLRDTRTHYVAGNSNDCTDDSMDSTLRNPDINIERINVPADPRHYWRWRMHITLEELMKQDEFNEYIRSMIEESGRSVSEQTEEAE